MNKYKVKICDKEISISQTRTAAIKAHCTDCSGGQRTEVKECPNKLCPLYVFRGYVAWDREKREMTDEQKITARDRLIKARQSKDKPNSN